MSLPLARAVKQTLFRAGWHTHKLRGDRLPGVAVLCYHAVREDGTQDRSVAYESLHVRASELDAHCGVIRRSCDPISLDDWRAAVRGEAPLPPRPVLMTFDDGYRSVFSLARPILSGTRFPP